MLLHFCVCLFVFGIVVHPLDVRMCVYFSFIASICYSGLNDNDADKSTGRALDDNRGFSFPLKDIAFSSTDKATNHRYNAKPNVVYAASPVSRKF